MSDSAMALDGPASAPFRRQAQPVVCLLQLLALSTAPLLSGAASAEEVNHLSVEGSGHHASRLGPAAGRSLRVKRRWHQPSFYGGFAEGESTYDFDADGGRVGPHSSFQDGWEPSVQSPYREKGMVPAEWFHESESGGPKVAWQTHYPALQGGIANYGIRLGAWKEGSAGVWYQEYKTEADSTVPLQDGNWLNVLRGGQELKPGWFDSSVDQIDGFGRPKLPSLGSGKRYVTWLERAVNTTLACSAPGCTATATLQAFDPAREQATHCRFAAHAMPTDFEQKGGIVEYIEVNGQTVSTACRPSASSCNATASRALHPCVQSLDLEKLMTSDGALNIAAKISDSVSQCPYQGNNLYAVPMVTCLVTTDLPPVANLAKILSHEH